MAKQKHGLFGPVSGKPAPLPAGVWKGIPYYKLLPDQGSEKKPRSAARIANEQRMAFMDNALLPFHNHNQVSGVRVVSPAKPYKIRTPMTVEMLAYFIKLMMKEFE